MAEIYMYSQGWLKSSVDDWKNQIQLHKNIETYAAVVEVVIVDPIVEMALAT